MTFDEYVATRLGALVRYATVVTCDPHLAEDITQDVLIKAQARWSRIGGLDAPDPYLKRMVLHEFLSWRRRRAARHVPMGLRSLDRAMGAVADPTAATDQRDALLRVIASLPPKQRAAVALRFYEDLSDDAIADLLGCRAGTVRSHISLALRTMRGVLAPQPATTAWRA